jgi:threonine dehydrogenase-like Zn-dependent dehydrogenase
VSITATERVLVVGDGKLGQLVAQTLALTGCELHVTGRHGPKLALLTARDIATTTPEAVEPRSYDVVIECSGGPEGFEVARRGVRARGTIVMKSTYAGPFTLDASAIVVDEITLVGSRCGPFPKALMLLADGRVDVLPLVAARYSLSRGLEAFEHAQRPGTLKVLLETE